MLRQFWFTRWLFPMLSGQPNVLELDFETVFGCWLVAGLAMPLAGLISSVAKPDRTRFWIGVSWAYRPAAPAVCVARLAATRPAATQAPTRPKTSAVLRLIRSPP